jgi:hypothetical protein
MKSHILELVVSPAVCCSPKIGQIVLKMVGAEVVGNGDGAVGSAVGSGVGEAGI